MSNRSDDRPGTAPSRAGVETPRAGQPGHSGSGLRGGSQDLAGRRYGTGTALHSPGKPAPLTPPPPHTTAFEEGALALDRVHGERIRSGSAQVGVPPESTAAVLLAESHLVAPRTDDRMPIRFEPWRFYQQTGRWLVATHKDQGAEYRAFAEARTIDPAAAHACLRMGMAQLSGAEAQAAGFGDAPSMLAALEHDPAAQIEGLVAVVGADADLRTAMAAGDWRTVASMRAGPGFGAIGYDDALAAWAEAWRRLERAPKRGGGDDDDGDKGKKRGKGKSREP